MTCIYFLPELFTAKGQQLVVDILHDNLSDTYKKTRYKPFGAEWPPNQPKVIVSVALVHYKGKKTKQELFQIASRYREGPPAIDKLVSNYQGPSAKRPRLDHSRITKDITDIFAPDPNTNELPTRILIEGAPGIGKTVLAKEIAYCWASNTLLNNTNILFLLILRDPALQKVEDFKQLIQYVSRGSLTNQQIDTFISQLNSVKLGFVLDGFDEYPSKLMRRSYIVSIINGEVFPNSIVVITSRPTATISLHDRVDRKIDILGFAKEEREEYILQSLDKEKKEELDKYLKQKPTINTLCFIPLHLAVLLYLFQQGSLPETLTEMNESFIIHTIFRHLKKHELTPSGVIDKLDKIPKPILDIVYQLAKLAFKGLQQNKLIFTLVEIEEACPNISGAINGFGLLQAVQHYPHYPKKGAGETMTFNFLHYTMQEYLAAQHVTALPDDEQVSLMEKTFWDSQFNFMWMMYVGIVGVKAENFVKFISKGKVYKNKNELRVVVTDKRKRLHVFQCFMEAKSTSDTPEVITSMFKDGRVTLDNVKLFPHHISSLTLFISTSSINWKVLQLRNCEIGGIGMSVLEQFVSEHTIPTLKYFDLSNNPSSPWGVYRTIIRHCSSNSLTLCGDDIDGMEEHVSEITESLQVNTKLLSLTLHIYSIGINGMQTIETVIVNTTLTEVNLPYYDTTHQDSHPPDITKECQYLVHTGMNFNGSKVVNIRMFSSVLCYDNFTENQISALNFLLCSTALQTLKVAHISNNRLTDNIITIISDCLQINNDSLQELIINHNKITNEGLTKLAVTIQVNKMLKKVDLSKNEITDDGVAAISECLKYNSCLQELNVSQNMITSEGAKKISEAIKLNTALQKLDICRNKITDDGLVAISDCLNSSSICLQDLNVSWNCITTKGLLYLLEIIQCSCPLQSLDITNNNVTRSEFRNIKHSIKNLPHTFPIHTSWNEITTDQYGGTTLKSMICTLYNNSDDGSDDIEQYIWTCEETFSDTGIILLCDCIKEDKTTQELNMSYKNITSEGAKCIAEAIKVNTTLQKLDIHYNKLSDDGATAISEYLKYNNSLQELNMWGNSITSEGAKCIAEAIKVNTTLQKLDIHNNKLSDDGATTISECLKYNNSLQELNMSYNNITSEGAKSIAEAIKVNTSLHTLDIYQFHLSDDDGLSFNMTILTAVHHNTTLMKLELPRVYGDNKVKIISEVEKINKERTRQDISTLTCDDQL